MGTVTEEEMVDMVVSFHKSLAKVFCEGKRGGALAMKKTEP